MVIPVHNGVKHIREAVESALAQQGVDLEVVVADNASTDGTSSVLASISDPRLRVLRVDAVIPVEENWTRAVAASQGDFVKLLCADDVLLPGCVSTQVAALQGEPSAVMAACARRIIDEASRTVLSARGLAGLSGLVNGREAARASVRAGTNIFGEAACVLFRGETLRSCMPWSGSRPYVIDLELYFRLLRHGDVVMQPEALAAFRVSLGSWSHALRWQQARAFMDLANDQAWCASAVDVRVGSWRAQLHQLYRSAFYLALRLQGAVGMRSVRLSKGSD